MYQIDNSTAVASLPTPGAPGPNPNSYFTGGNPGTLPATIVDSDWLNAVQQELISILQAAGLTPSKSVHNQVLESLEDLFTTTTYVNTAVTAEATRAEAAESNLSVAISDEVTNRTNAVSAETSRAQGAETSLSNSIVSETNRATAAENVLSTNISNETARAETAEATKAPINAPAFTGGASVSGAFTILNPSTTQNGGFQVESFGSSTTPAMVCDVGLVGGPTTFSVGASYYLGNEGISTSTGVAGGFGFMTGYAAQAVTFYATSDMRLKRNIKTMAAAEGRRFVETIDPSTFEKIGRGFCSGYIAQQLVVEGYEHLVNFIPINKQKGEASLPEADHVINGKGIRSVKDVKMIADYDAVIPYLHSALRDAFREIADLTARLARLETAAAA